MPNISQPGVTYSGPLFDGSSLRIVAAMMKAADKALGQAGVNLVELQLSNNLRNPSGFYQSQIRTDNKSTGAVISDGGVIYGPWLEGTGSRNRTTKFKGYSSFRKAGQQLNQAAEYITQQAISQYVKQLNGS